MSTNAIERLMEQENCTRAEAINLITLVDNTSSSIVAELLYDLGKCLEHDEFPEVIGKGPLLATLTMSVCQKFTNYVLKPLTAGLDIDLAAKRDIQRQMLDHIHKIMLADVNAQEELH